ncbi:DeoR/GlpR family DNA-binding transcription regulator [Neptunicoccus cionae]|uniref:DeoR family transcriptional regulator n=1 Tax=Neptunicoccus cionae TaxID=2035344 RepID=A0A916VSA5_9RHOB|nr:DeoR/GlpR family DNA-binding transcription regulator [Amylibacter cionae]GGA27584.1 DeoR family transcriptional regulator [Amylibacter cionae]
MWAQDRHQRILNVLQSNRQVSANDLADLLNVSRETVRRDLLELERDGLVDRVHGGAVLPRQENEAPFETRKGAHHRAKQDIARKAVSLIPAGSSIMVDAGTTTTVFGEVLAKLSGIMVVTNSIDIAQTIRAAGSDIDLILLGGQIVSDVPATYGEMTLSEIARFNVDQTFIAPVAADAHEGAFSFEFKEAEVARAMVAQAREAVLLCDRSKLGETSRVRFCEASRIDTLVTDSKARPDQIDPFKTAGTTVVI